MPELIRTAVIGVGYLGRFHAQKYSALPQCELVAVVDTDTQQCQSIATELGVVGLSDYRDLFGKVDAVSIAVPTIYHYKTALDCLKNKLHVLVEKPITTTTDEAQALIQVAENNSLTLQTGHLERFNAAFVIAAKKISAPRFIEAHRLAPFTIRGTDVNVILDLMIHDIDLCCSLIDSEIHHIEASGTGVLTSGTDIANARLVFKNGAVANLTASRISDKRERKMRIFQQSSCLSVDFQNNQVKVYRADQTDSHQAIPAINSEMISLDSSDAIKDEICDFIGAIQDNRQPQVSGKEGLKALDIALKISQKIKNETSFD